MGLKSAVRGSKVKVSQTQDNWCTPANVRDAIVEFNFGRQIALDPATNPNSIIGARHEWYGSHFTGPCDPQHRVNGLVASWSVAVGGLVFFNPPFSGKFIWVRKSADEAAKFSRHVRDTHIIGLLPNDSDTSWYQDVAVPTSQAQCFWKGRLVFRGDVDFPARFPIVLFYWGRHCARFKKFFSNYGWCP